ncbi:MAG: hypothetical protein HRU19_29375 [Pseudobacteriovorax sp.]|nr:hypothetical protein [Pseudobacteriovorax sp.]
MKVTITELEKLTGITFKTLKKRLEDTPVSRTTNKEVYFDSKVALQAIFNNESKETLKLDQERAKLAHIQTKKLELEYQKMQGTLVDANEIIEEFGKRMLAMKAKFLKIPVRLGALFNAFSSASELENEAENLIYEALEEAAEPACKSSIA